MTYACPSESIQQVISAAKFFGVGAPLDMASCYTMRQLYCITSALNKPFHQLKNLAIYKACKSLHIMYGCQSDLPDMTVSAPEQMLIYIAHETCTTARISSCLRASHLMLQSSSIPNDCKAPLHNSSAVNNVHLCLV